MHFVKKRIKEPPFCVKLGFKIYTDAAWKQELSNIEVFIKEKLQKVSTENVH